MTVPGSGAPGLGGGYTVEWMGAKGGQPVPSLFPVTNSPLAGAGGAGGAGAVTAGVARVGRVGTTVTDLQEIEVTLGAANGSPGAVFPDGGSFDIFGRVNDPFTTFIKASISAATAVISVVVDGISTVIGSTALDSVPAMFETFALRIGEVVSTVVGVVGAVVETVVNTVVTLVRGGVEILRTVIDNALLVVGSAFRGIGFGSTSPSSTTAPPSILGIFIRDIVPAPIRSGHISLTNFGTQDGWPRYLCYGPGTFRIANGAGSTEMIEFGPLLSGQIALLTTLPRLRSVVDLSPAGASTQQLSQFQTFIKLLISLATNNNVPPLLELFESLFGILPPQGEMYSLLKGRFTKPIPPKPAGGPPTTAVINVQILDGTTTSKIVAALTPLRRWPE